MTAGSNLALAGCCNPPDEKNFAPEGNNVRRKTYDSAPEYQA